MPRIEVSISGDNVEIDARLAAADRLRRLATEEFGFPGTPIDLSMKIREKRKNR